MKKYLLQILLIGIILIFVSCQIKQNGFEISANLEGFSENSKVVLSDAGSAKILDSVKIQNGRFQFKGKLESSPTELSLVILPSDGNDIKSTMIFIGNENVKIMGNKNDFPSMLKIEGSIHQNIKSDLDQKTEPYDTEFDTQIQKMIGLRNENKWNDSLQTVYWGENGVFEKIDNKILGIKKEFIEKNINTYYGLKLLAGMKVDLPKEFVLEQFDRVDSKYKTTEYAKAIAIYLNNEPLKNNDKFYNFRAENQNGKMIEFSDFFDDERYVLLEFYSPHCRWCKMALPKIKQLADSKKDSLKVVTFNVDKDKEDWLKTNKANEINWSSLWDKDGRYSETYTKYRVRGTPTYYLFDGEGKVISMWNGFDENTIANIERQIK